MENEVSMLDTLKAEINTFVTAYKGKFLTKEALMTLLKTFQTKNITIQDWNTLVNYVEQNFSSMEDLSKLMMTLSEYVVLKPLSIFVTVESEDFVIPEEAR